mgnify:FL=1
MMENKENSKLPSALYDVVGQVLTFIEEIDKEKQEDKEKKDLRTRKKE